MLLDYLPVWAVFLGTLALLALALEIGFRLGKRRLARGVGKAEGAGAMVGATMGLVAFMLAFTFNWTANRHDNRKALVIEEANAIEQTWLRAGLLPERYPPVIRELLREYVDMHVKAATGELKLGVALARSEELQQRMWTLAVEAGHENQASITTGLFIQSLNAMIDIQLERVTVGARIRVPGPIWCALYLLTVLVMGMMGMQVGLGGARHFGVEMALALAFSVVLFLIVDLDSPQKGLINVSQQAMTELQGKLDARR